MNYSSDVSFIHILKQRTTSWSYMPKTFPHTCHDQVFCVFMHVSIFIRTLSEKLVNVH